MTEKKKTSFEIVMVKWLDVNSYSERSNIFGKKELWERPNCFLTFGLLIEKWKNEYDMEIWRLVTVYDTRTLEDTEIKTRNEFFDIPKSLIIESRNLGEVEV